MEIKPISWQQTIPLRHKVLWPNKPAEFCYVDGDASALHYGVFIDQKLVCVASIYIDSHKARLRKFATDPSYQNQGIGTAMLKYIIASLTQANLKVFWCDARESALGFYQRYGMNKYSERFYKSDVPYYKLSVTL